MRGNNYIVEGSCGDFIYNDDNREFRIKFHMINETLFKGIYESEIKREFVIGNIFDNGGVGGVFMIRMDDEKKEQLWSPLNGCDRFFGAYDCSKEDMKGKIINQEYKLGRFNEEETRFRISLPKDLDSISIEDDIFELENNLSRERKIFVSNYVTNNEEMIVADFKPKIKGLAICHSGITKRNQIIKELNRVKNKILAEEFLFNYFDLKGNQEFLQDYIMNNEKIMNDICDPKIKDLINWHNEGSQEQHELVRLAEIRNKIYIKALKLNDCNCDRYGVTGVIKNT